MELRRALLEGILTPNMAEAKRTRSKNYTEYEKTLLKQIVANHAVIESKGHSAAIEQRKRSAWAALCSEFNENVTTRALQQLQTLWKNIKLDLKKRNAEARRERFTTGGGPPPSKDKTDELADLLTGIMEDQQPLDGIPDDDHLDSGHEEVSTNEEIIRTLVEEPVHSDCAPSTSGMASRRKDAATTFQQRPKRMSMHEKYLVAWPPPTNSTLERPGEKTKGGEREKDQEKFERH
ncbi:unnamed protein product [Arctogadus glacialis]